MLGCGSASHWSTAPPTRSRQNRLRECLQPVYDCEYDPHADLLPSHLPGSMQVWNENAVITKAIPANACLRYFARVCDLYLFLFLSLATGSSPRRAERQPGLVT